MIAKRIPSPKGGAGFAQLGAYVLNAKTARSQLIGGIVYGIGMALMEETHVDEETGRVVNSNISEYLVPVNADVPAIEAAWFCVAPFLEKYAERHPEVSLVQLDGEAELWIPSAEADRATTRVSRTAVISATTVGVS